MPYSQIISLMVALVLITGAPSNHHLSFSITEGLALWGLKTLLWWLSVTFLLKRSSIERQQTLFERLQAAALMPLVIDFYMLDIKDMLALIPGFSTFPILEEFAGLAMYFGYLTILWGANWHINRHKSLETWPLSQEIKERFSLILPALIPYLVLSAGLEAASRFAPDWMQALFNSNAAPFISLGAFTLVLIFFIPPLLRKIWQCTPMPEGRLKTEILNFLKKSGISFEEIYVWPLGGGKACTAAVVGIIPKFRYILITPCLLKYLQPGEIEAVLSHEAEHVLRRHILWYVFFLGAYSIVLFRLMDPLWSWLVSRPFFISLLEMLENSPEALPALAAALPMLLLVVLYFRFLLGWFMRNFERQADISVFRTQGHPWHMISALEKVALFSGGIREKPSWHHYSIAQRVDFLQKAAKNPEILQQHNRKLVLSKGIFIAAALILLILPDMMPVKAWKKSANTNLAEAYLAQLSSHGQENARWFVVLGQLMAENHQYKKAAAAYLKALELEPDNPDILNNLAWLYATAEDRKARKPREALMLAIKAASIRPDSYILDTLAECFFINGYVEKALETEQEALQKAVSNRDYYQKQIMRFSRALGHENAP